MAAKDGGDTSRAFAICTRSLQKAGKLKQGTQKLTKSGKGNAISRGKDKENTASKDAAYERALATARGESAESIGKIIEAMALVREARR